jgi:plastocyanin
MRRSIALVLATVLALTVAGEARAATVSISIVNSTAGFSPKTASGAIGTTFTWKNSDSIDHTSTQNSPLSLWNSGHIVAANTFSKTINFAGSYPYHCTIHPLTMKGTVKVPLRVSPASGSVGTSFIISVANRKAPSGFVYDIQRRKGSGAWTAWRTGITAKSATFKPSSSGTWSFRSRLRKTSNGAKSGWSPARSVTVT